MIAGDRVDRAEVDLNRGGVVNFLFVQSRCSRQYPDLLAQKKRQGGLPCLDHELH